MHSAQEHRGRAPDEMAAALQARVEAGARRYRGAVMRYLLRPPLSLKPKYAAFLIDFSRQSDHMQDVLGRAAERVGDPGIAEVLRAHQKEERGRMQLVMGDLRRLGYPAESWPAREYSTGDAALRGYVSNLSFERPVAMLGILLMIIGLAAEIAPNIVRLLTVSGIPRESMRWMILREGADPAAFKDLCSVVAQHVQDPADQAAVLEAVEVSGELLAMGAAARSPL